MDYRKLYIASPLGFSETGRFFLYERLVPAVREAGFEVLDPWTLTSKAETDAVLSIPGAGARADAWRKLNLIMAARNEEAIRSAHGLLAVLDGPDVDSGTAAEIGFAYALGKKILGYRSDFRLAGDNEGSIINLQVEYFIRQGGGILVSSLSDLQSNLARVM